MSPFSCSVWGLGESSPGAGLTPPLLWLDPASLKEQYNSPVHEGSTHGAPSTSAMFAVECMHDTDYCTLCPGGEPASQARELPSPGCTAPCMDPLHAPLSSTSYCWSIDCSQLPCCATGRCAASCGACPAMSSSHYY